MNQLFSTSLIMQMKVNGRIWVDTEEGSFLGVGRIELLEKIKKHHSIRQAALEMKMSYRQAWDLIDQMNARSKMPLVISHRGGKGGGRAEVTEEGQRLIHTFHQLNDKFKRFLEKETKSLNI